MVVFSRQLKVQLKMAKLQKTRGSSLIVSIFSLGGKDNKMKQS